MNLLRLALLSFLLLGLTACQPDTPAEKAEEAMEDLGDAAGDAAEDLGDAIDDGIDEAEDAVDDAADELDNN